MDGRGAKRFAGGALAPALALALLLAPAALAAQDFDLRPRATPTPAPPPVVGPVDPDNPQPTVRARPTPEPRATAAAPLVVPTFASPTPDQRSSASPPAASTRNVRRETGEAAGSAPTSAEPTLPTAGAPASAPATRPATGPYVERQLNAVRGGGGGLIWALAMALLALLAVGGWLAWSRHFRLRAKALPAPEIVRPHVASRTPAAEPPLPDALPKPAITLRLEATRMSATLVNTTLSYRLAVTNTGAEALREVIVAGDMIAAHASRAVEELLGPAGTALPELHRIAGLAPGESVTLGGDIRLPLVSITPIRKGNAALFVPLARLRARATDPAGAAVEGGGTFLVGQPGAQGASAKGARLQPFRLDLGPRNYSRLGQQLLPAA
ncbi:MAG TPA: hypothetical protein VM055_00445 [Novosphingobium sp.]|nr:hypothetical protein [Novosphingobium sp.]